jgi:hypothetical protein
MAQAACDFNIRLGLINRRARATPFVGSLNPVWARKADHHFESLCMSGTEVAFSLLVRGFLLSENKTLIGRSFVVPTGVWNRPRLAQFNCLNEQRLEHVGSGVFDDVALGWSRCDSLGLGRLLEPDRAVRSIIGWRLARQRCKQRLRETVAI